MTSPSRPQVAPPPPPPPPPSRGAEVDTRAMGRMRQDEMRRRSGGAQVLAGETTGSTVTGTKKLLGE
jgi:hypothetical protein